MWLLILILSTPVPNIDKVTALGTFDSHKECEERRQYVETEMAKAYPLDTSYKLMCTPFDKEA